MTHNAFQKALERSFIRLGVSGVYRLANGQEIETRFMSRQNDVMDTFGSSRFALATHRFDVLSLAIPQPQEGDHLTVNRQTYEVVGAPLADRDRMIWTLTGAPV